MYEKYNGSEKRNEVILSEMSIDDAKSIFSWILDSLLTCFGLLMELTLRVPQRLVTSPQS